MLIAVMLLLDAGSSAIVPASSVALRSNARTALPGSTFTSGLAIVDEQGVVVGKVVSSEQGMVMVKTPHTLIRVPTSAFLMRGGPIMIGIPAAQVNKLTLIGLPTR